MVDAKDGITVAVTSDGKVTVPKEVLEKINIGTPSRIRFVENENGEIILRPVKRPSTLQGALAPEGEDELEKLATEQLRKEREHDKQKTDERYRLSNPK